MHDLVKYIKLLIESAKKENWAMCILKSINKRKGSDN